MFLFRLAARRAVHALLVLLLALFGFLAPLPRSQAQVAGDNGWDSRFGLPGAGGNLGVLAVASGADGSIVIGGDFEVVGATRANRVARWDGSRWTALGTGLNGPVYDVLVRNNEIFVAGDFDQAGGIATRGVARFDLATNSWSTLGGGLNTLSGQPASGRALHLDGANLYVGGAFTDAGGVAAANFARWNGSAWAAQGQFGNTVWDIESLNGTLYAAGDFSGTPTLGVARWNGSAWVGLGLGINGVARALLAVDDTLVVGGNFTLAGGQPAANIARFNPVGDLWTPLGGGVAPRFNTPVAALTRIGNDLYVGGDLIQAGGLPANQIARWNLATNSWSTLGRGLSGDPVTTTVYDLAASDGGLIVGGNFSAADGVGALNLARFDGSAFRAFLPGQAGLGSSPAAVGRDLAGDGRELFVAGNFLSAGAATAWGVARWTGAAWAPLGGGFDSDNDTLRALAISAGFVYVGGDFNDAGGVAATKIARWNRAAGGWQPLGSGITGGGAPLEALAVSPAGNLYAGGSFSLAGGQPAANVARWSESSQTWAALGSGITGAGTPKVYAIATLGNGVFVGGSFDNAGGQPAAGIARWDETTQSWSTLGQGVNGTVFALAASGSNLFVGGDFQVNGVSGIRNIARWDTASNSWFALDQGVDGPVNALAVENGQLYAGGSFSSVNNAAIAAQNIARFSLPAGGWAALGSGVDGPVNGLAFHQGALFATGAMNSAGGRPAQRIARWNPLGDGLPPSVDGVALDQQGRLANQRRVNLTVAAGDNGGGAGYLYLAEYLLTDNGGNAGFRLVAESGWLTYGGPSLSYAWTLTDQPGVHYLQVWIADRAGNISTQPALAYASYAGGVIAIGAGETHVYRIQPAAGQARSVQLDANSGDPDLYLYDGRNLRLSGDDFAADPQIAGFTADGGLYQIEVAGFSAGSYSLTLVGGQATLSAAPAQGRPRGQVFSIGGDPDPAAITLPVPPRGVQVALPLIRQ